MSVIKVKFPKPDQIVINKHIDFYNDYETPIYILNGGRYGAKGASIGRKLVKKCLKSKYFKCGLGMKEYNRIKEGVYDTIKKYIENYNLSELFKFNSSPLEIVCVNGNKFIARGFDKSKKVKGIEGLTDFWIDEVIPDITKEDFENALGTLRGVKYPQMILSFNPEPEILEQCWIYNDIFKDRYEKDFSHIQEIELNNKKLKFEYKIIHTTFKDNPYLGYIEQSICEKWKNDYEKTRSQDNRNSQLAEYYYHVWYKGEWFEKNIDLRFWTGFNEIDHINELELNIDEPIHISFDKNVNPYITCAIWQIYNKDFEQIHELCLPNPENKTYIVIQRLIKWLKENKFNNRIYIYGDSTALRDDPNLPVGTNFYKIITNELEKQNYRYELRIPGKRSNTSYDFIRKRKNPNVINSADFINDIFSRNLYGYSITINESCTKSILDYKNLKQGSDGKPLKERNKDGHEKYGHISDAMRYLICEYAYDDFVNYCNRNF